MEPVPEIPKEDEGVGLFSTGIVYLGCILSITKNKIAEWAIEVRLYTVSNCTHIIKEKYMQC